MPIIFPLGIGLLMYYPFCYLWNAMDIYFDAYAINDREIIGVLQSFKVLFVLSYKYVKSKWNDDVKVKDVLYDLAFNFGFLKEGVINAFKEFGIKDKIDSYTLSNVMKALKVTG